MSQRTRAAFQAHIPGALAGDDIYVLGGQLEDDAATATKASYRYNPSTDRWLALPPLPSRLSQSCAVALRRDVFE